MTKHLKETDQAWIDRMNQKIEKLHEVEEKINKFMAFAMNEFFSNGANLSDKRTVQKLFYRFNRYGEDYRTRIITNWRTRNFRRLSCGLAAKVRSNRKLGKI